MAPSSPDPAFELSILIPANNEAARIDACLGALLASNWSRPGKVEVVVVANGCTDNTAGIAMDCETAFADRGWSLVVMEQDQGNKLVAINTAEAVARGSARLYLDADVTVSPGLVQALAAALDTDKPLFASGTLTIAEPNSAISRAYRRIWRQVPFMAQGVPGCGVFAVNAAGRDRWEAFPDIVSDDTFVRLHFAPEERVSVPETYNWPIAEGLRNLIRVRRRQDRGVTQIGARFPELLANDDKRPLPRQSMVRMALKDPIGFAAYAGVALVVRLTGQRAEGEWSRGR